ncbi:hypothetical protein C5C52_14400, partial [Rathayibacter sp. AY1E5]
MHGGREREQAQRERREPGLVRSAGGRVPSGRGRRAMTVMRPPSQIAAKTRCRPSAVTAASCPL